MFERAGNTAAQFSDGESPAFVDSSPSPSPHNFCNVESESESKSYWLGLESEYNILLKNESKRVLFSVH